MAPKWLRLSGWITGGLCLLLVWLVILFYGRIGEKVLREKALPKIAARLGGDIKVQSISVEWGLATLHGISVFAPEAASKPWLTVSRAQIRFAFFKSLLGKAEPSLIVVDGADVELDLQALPFNRKKPTASGDGDSVKRPKFVLRNSMVAVKDGEKAVTAMVSVKQAMLDPDGEISVDLNQLVAASSFGAYADFQDIHLTTQKSDPLNHLAVHVSGGSLHLWRGLSLNEIRGDIVAKPDQGKFTIEMEGGYAGVAGTLWQAHGFVATGFRSGQLKLQADRFEFSKLRPILEGSSVVDFDNTSMDASVEVNFDEKQVRVTGGGGISGLNVFHPGLAKETVRDISGKGSLALAYDRNSKSLQIEDATLTSKDVTANIRGHIDFPAPELARAATALELQLVIPQVQCQSILQVIPTALASKLKGFVVKGNFDTDVTVKIDWADLEATQLLGKVGFTGCKVTKAPADMSAENLMGNFIFQVETEPNKWVTAKMGPENPNFVPLSEVSPHLINSLMTTEDSGFMTHHGWNPREFETALIKDLQAGGYKYGASSISMQMVKNVLLNREKTASRKFQELFLTWYLEANIPKERILEIYVNAIEYGPGLYGIKPATLLYFGKLPRDISPVEAAFFSSILPAPKRRYIQFCRGEITGWTQAKIQRILALMLKRQRLTQDEYNFASMTPLFFAENREEFCAKNRRK